MTKKFWADWQKRIGETKNIYRFYKYKYSDGKIYLSKWPGSLLNSDDKLIKATFHGDAVDLVIERHNTVIDWNTCSLKQHVENEYLTLHRDEIATIEFIKYY